MLLSLYMESEAVRIERETKEEAQRKAEEEKKEKELRRQKYNDEVDKLEALKNAAADFEMACKIRAYISAIECTPNLSQEQEDWIMWAKAKADWYDPTKDVLDDLFGKRNHSSPNEPKKQGYYW